jgi:hypothetical protein
MVPPDAIVRAFAAKGKSAANAWTGKRSRVHARRRPPLFNSVVAAESSAHLAVGLSMADLTFLLAASFVAVSCSGWSGDFGPDHGTA